MPSGFVYSVFSVCISWVCSNCFPECEVYFILHNCEAPGLDSFALISNAQKDYLAFKHKKMYFIAKQM